MWVITTGVHVVKLVDGVSSDDSHPLRACPDIMEDVQVHFRTLQQNQISDHKIHEKIKQ